MMLPVKYDWKVPYSVLRGIDFSCKVERGRRAQKVGIMAKNFEGAWRLCVKFSVEVSGFTRRRSF